jgi:hypothetical protein
MADYLFLMHDDATADETASWSHYIGMLKLAGAFDGGSEIGDGVCVRKKGAPPPVTGQLIGYIRVSAPDIAHAQLLLAGNPHFEAGGTIEIRELPRTG